MVVIVHVIIIIWNFNSTLDVIDEINHVTILVELGNMAII